MMDHDPKSDQNTVGSDGNTDEPSFDTLASLVRDVASTMAMHNLRSVDLKYHGLKLSLVGQDDDARQDVRAPAREEASADTPAGTLAEDEPGVHTVTAPMIGTFYVAPAPNEPSFVNRGDVVEEGQTIGIIEAMKIMNEIASDMAGEVVEVIANNGETVEFGSPLVTLRTAG